MLAGCAPERPATPPAPAPDYQAPTPSLPPGPAACYDRDDLAVLRNVMLHSALVVAALHCKAEALEPLYARYVAKFGADLADSRRRLKLPASWRRLSVDALYTELVGRAGQRTATDAQFCARARRAFDWALDPLVTSLDQVPPPYDMGWEIGAYPCPDK